MAEAAFKGKLSISGSPVNFIDSRMEVVTGKTNTYRSVTPSERILDPSVAVILKNNNVVIADTEYEVNYLNGEITTNSAYTVGNLRLTGSRVSIVHIANLKAYNVSENIETIDVTPMSGENTVGNGTMQYIYGLRSVSITTDIIRDSNNFFPLLSNVASNLRTIKDNRGFVFIQAQTRETVPYDEFIGWFNINSNITDTGVNNALMENIEFMVSSNAGALYQHNTIT